MKTYVEIDFKNREHFQLLHDFYQTVYEKGVPDEDERESFENIIKQAHAFSRSPKAEYHCLLVCIEGQVVGGIIGDYFAECNCGIVEFLIVAEAYRRHDLGRELFCRLREQFYLDAVCYGYKHGMDYCFFETENPFKLGGADEDKGIQRLKILSRITTGILDMDYKQPPLEEGKQAVDYLYLGICVLNSELSEEVVEAVRVKQFLEEYFRYAFSGSSLDDCSDYVNVASLQAEEFLNICKMEDLIEKHGRI